MTTDTEKKPAVRAESPLVRGIDGRTSAVFVASPAIYRINNLPYSSDGSPVCWAWQNVKEIADAVGMEPIVVWNWYVYGNVHAQWSDRRIMWKVLHISADGETYQIEDVLQIGEQFERSKFAGDRYFFPAGWAQSWVTEQVRLGIPNSNATAYDHVLKD